MTRTLHHILIMYPHLTRTIFTSGLFAERTSTHTCQCLTASVSFPRESHLLGKPLRKTLLNITQVHLWIKNWAASVPVCHARLHLFVSKDLKRAYSLASSEIYVAYVPRILMNSLKDMIYVQWFQRHLHGTRKRQKQRWALN